MAKTEQPSESRKRAKRRLKPETSVREQRAKQQGSDKAKRRPLRAVGRGLSWPFRRIAARDVWRSKPLAPLRWLFKIIGYILFIPYIRASFAELKKVTWPTRRESIRLTWAVLVFSVFFGVILAVLDYGLDKVFKKLILNS